MSLSLLGLLTEVMTMIGMEHLNFTGTGYSISFARSSVCLDLSHFFVSFRFRKCCCMAAFAYISRMICLIFAKARYTQRFLRV